MQHKWTMQLFISSFKAALFVKHQSQGSNTQPKSHAMLPAWTQCNTVRWQPSGTLIKRQEKPSDIISLECCALCGQAVWYEIWLFLCVWACVTALCVCKCRHLFMCVYDSFVCEMVTLLFSFNLVCDMWVCVSFMCILVHECLYESLWVAVMHVLHVWQNVYVCVKRKEEVSKVIWVHCVLLYIDSNTPPPTQPPELV